MVRAGKALMGRRRVLAKSSEVMAKEPMIENGGIMSERSGKIPMSRSEE